MKFKNQPKNSFYECKKNLSSRQVFAAEEEQKLTAYIKKRANMCYELRKKAIHEFAYDYTKANQK